MPIPALPGTKHLRRMDYIIMRNFVLLSQDPLHAAEKLAGEWPCSELGMYDLRCYELLSSSCYTMVSYCSRWASANNELERLLVYPIVSEEENRLMYDLCSPRKTSLLRDWYIRLDESTRSRLRGVMSQTIRTVFESGVKDSTPLVVSAWRLRDGPPIV